MSQKILSALTANYELYEYFDTYRTRVSARTIFVDLYIGYEPTLTMDEILIRNHKIAEDIQAFVPNAVINCVLIGSMVQIHQC